MNTSPQTTEVMPAVVALQVGLTNPTTDAKARVKMKQGGEYGYSYLSLPKLLDHISKPRRESGLAISQEITGDAGFVGVTTYLIHLSGQWVAFGPAVFPAPSDPQQRGAVVSYARRYSLLAALGLAAEDDDAASAKVEPVPAPTSTDGPEGRPQGDGKASAEGSGAPASGPTPEVLAYGEGASTEGAGEGGPGQPGNAEAAETPSLAITPEQIEVLKTAAGGVQKARAASQAKFGKDWRELTAEQGFELLNAIREATSAGVPA